MTDERLAAAMISRCRESAIDEDGQIYYRLPFTLLPSNLMRPALLRLLKRPSALSVLDSLISIPTGVEQLDVGNKFKCLRCLSKASKQAKSVPVAELQHTPANESSFASTKRTFSFRIYEIHSPHKQAAAEGGGSVHPYGGEETALDSRCLGLQPERLDYESDIGHTDDIGSRLVDDPVHRNNFALWEELLRYRQRHYGDKGTLDIWEGLTARVDGVQLPVHGEVADFFWQSFVDAGLRRDVILNEVADYALALWDTTGKRWDKLYESVIGGLIDRGMAQQAVEWHKKLQHPHLTRPNDILQVFRPNLTIQPQSRVASLMKSGRRATSPSLWAFRSICRMTRGHQIYVPIMSTLLRSGHFDDMLSMHRFLTQRNDHPHSFDDFGPLLESTKECGPWEIYQELHSYASQRFPDKPHEPEKIHSHAQTETSEEASHDERPIKDGFGARIFATEALNFETILSGLTMFNVPALGPQSLREMALRTHGSQDLLDKLRKLDRAGISLGNSVFTRLLRKLASENRDILLSDLIRTDQHPDVLEDTRIQENLLAAHYMSQDWRAYNMTLAILNEIAEEGPDMSNIHFRKHIEVGEWALASKLVDEMTLRRKRLTEKSIDLMVNKILTHRHRSLGPPKGPTHPGVVEITSLFRILRRVVPLGASVAPGTWVEMIKQFGMMNCWDELRTCCLWLARHYSLNSKTNNASLEIISPSTSLQSVHSTPVHRHGNSMLATVFNKQMQGALVYWGFRMRVSTKRDDYNPFGVDGERLVPWVRGLVLLRDLEQNGVRLWVRRVSRACRHRLAVLFGRPRRSSRHMNRMLRRENPYSVERVVADINRAWGQPPLFQGRESRDIYRLVNPPSSKMSQRRTRRTLLREKNLRGAAFVSTR
ncbi:uncharacterized protein BO80DRAFT_486365 [Aspergillus ibericus CBS 121593]|uniref:Uncharacterized protein n=1 Tax=Aspergillus ibericus CBS 121593 TaxID=1448316 RepID=A0A395H8S5_9EURO|nr:hypothetical protein BO80DRAFT_486365 [Aspergillus ibericus CBS 121593]RAL04080.1 hypothetical protein BO80DRAFT_486365 [Aspergillus ibericus CBS 121593]